MATVSSYSGDTLQPYFFTAWPARWSLSLQKMKLHRAESKSAICHFYSDKWPFFCLCLIVDCTLMHGSIIFRISLQGIARILVGGPGDKRYLMSQYSFKNKHSKLINGFKIINIQLPSLTFLFVWGHCTPYHQSAALKTHTVLLIHSPGTTFLLGL